MEQGGGGVAVVAPFGPTGGAVSTGLSVALPSGESLLETPAALAARRRRMEIRRFKLLAASGALAEPMAKRLRDFGEEAMAAASDVVATADDGEDNSLSAVLSPAVPPLLSKLPSDTSNLTVTEVDGHQRRRRRRQRHCGVLAAAALSPLHVPTADEEDASTDDSTSTTSSLSSEEGDSAAASMPPMPPPLTLTSLPSGETDKSMNTESSGGAVTELSDVDDVVMSEGTSAGLSVLPATVAVAATGEAEGDIVAMLPTAGNFAPTMGSSTASVAKTLSPAITDSKACPPHGVLSVCGRRREMEDTVAAVPLFVELPDGDGSQPHHFFAVYDGHGGAQAAAYCADHLHHVLAKAVEPVEPAAKSSEEPSVEAFWRGAMSVAFNRVDIEVNGFCGSDDANHDSGRCSACAIGAVAPETVGSTAIVAVVSASRVIVANAGDSRAVLSRGGKAVPLSSDHKPDREDEMARVEAAGGRVIYWNGYRVLGVLAMSRAIGDRYLKPYVIAEPEVMIVDRQLDDECLILGSDGLWDVISNDVACSIVRRCFASRRNGRGNSVRSKLPPSDLETGSVGSDDGNDDGEESPAAVAAAVLVKLALARGSSDNISAVVVDLQAHCGAAR
eukprot:SM000227S07445  [mRNA]  locus=s227:161275:163890:+ [translate_table: standard]